MIFKRICRMLHFVIFIKILEYRYIAKLLPLNTVAHNCCISGCFKSLWRSIRGRVIVSRVNRTVLKIYVTKPYQFEPTFAIHREKKQRKKKKEVLLYYVISSKNIGWHTNSASWCWDPDLLMNFFFFNYEAQHAKNKFEDRFAIPFWVQFYFQLFSLWVVDQ